MTKWLLDFFSTSRARGAFEYVLHLRTYHNRPNCVQEDEPADGDANKRAKLDHEPDEDGVPLLDLGNDEIEVDDIADEEGIPMLDLDELEIDLNDFVDEEEIPILDLGEIKIEVDDMVDYEVCFVQWFNLIYAQFFQENAAITSVEPSGPTEEEKKKKKDELIQKILSSKQAIEEKKKKITRDKFYRKLVESAASKVNVAEHMKASIDSLEVVFETAREVFPPPKEGEK